MTDPDHARDEPSISSVNAYCDGFNGEPAKSDNPTYLHHYEAGREDAIADRTERKIRTEERLPEEPPQPPRTDPGYHGPAEEHEDDFLTFTGLYVLRRACAEEGLF